MELSILSCQPQPPAGSLTQRQGLLTTDWQLLFGLTFEGLQALQQARDHFFLLLKLLISRLVLFSD